MKILNRVYQILFCLVGLVNFGFVIFDAAYLWKLPYMRVTTRDILLERAPNLVQMYDPVKGIEAHRFTSSYLEQADKAFATAFGANPRDAEKIYAELINMSKEMIDQKPGFSHFSIAEKDGTLQVIKNRMRKHYGNDSAKDAFTRFWTTANLTGPMAAEEKAFFDREIRPLMSQNYFRWIDEDGEMKDYFFKIDMWFVLFFWVDFLARWILAIARKQHRKWYLFPVRHCTEIFNLIPPHHAVWLRLLRAIPLYFRMKQARLIPGQSILPELLHDNAALIAEEISGMVLVNILDQMAVIVEKTDTDGLGQSEVVQVTRELLDTQIDRITDTVLPDVEPQITTLAVHSVYAAMGTYLRTPLAPILKMVLYAAEASIKDGLKSALTSEEGREEMKAILKKFLSEGITELTTKENLASVQKQSALLLDRLKHEILRGMHESE
ncbi:MAG: hypothetical protein JNM27_01485 [Leptospirales bacterium]|nr:hypothetical protein [Leptospirales bacterium]